MWSVGFVNTLRRQLYLRSVVLIRLKSFLGEDATWGNLPLKVNKIKIERDTAILELKKLKKNLQELRVQ